MLLFLLRGLAGILGLHQVDKALEFLDRSIDIDFLALEAVDPRLAALHGLEALGSPAVANVVEVEQFLDLREAEANALAAEDPRQAGAIAVGVEPLSPAPFRRDQLLILVKAKRASRHPKFVAKLADGIVRLVLKHEAALTLRFRKGQVTSRRPSTADRRPGRQPSLPYRPAGRSCRQSSRPARNNSHRLPAAGRFEQSSRQSPEGCGNRLRPSGSGPTPAPPFEGCPMPSSSRRRDRKRSAPPVMHRLHRRCTADRGPPPQRSL